MIRRQLAALVASVARASGLLRALRRRRHERGDFRLFVLEYHDVNAEVEREGTVTGERFRRHLIDVKKRADVESLVGSLEALLAGELRADRAAVTFDDGYQDNHDVAWPVLQQEGASATFFLTTGFLDGEPLWFDTARRVLEAAVSRESVPAEVAHILGGEPSDVESEMRLLKYRSAGERLQMTEKLALLDLESRPAARPLAWRQVAEMASQGAEFGAHTVSHPILSVLEPSEQRSEIEASRDRLRQQLGVPPAAFAYPNGSRRDYDQRTVQLVQDAGFSLACTTIRGSNAAGSDRWQLRRIGVGSDSEALLEARMEGLFDLWYRSQKQT